MVIEVADNVISYGLDVFWCLKAPLVYDRLPMVCVNTSFPFS